MSELHMSAAWPDDFCGSVRLFPLPNLVLFPNVVQPLHIFEPRYCDMLHDALQHDRLIAMALLKQGWEKKYQQTPAIAATVCVGRVISHVPTTDNRHNILLVGLKRARIIEELDAGTTFRQATVELLEDMHTEQSLEAQELHSERLMSLFLRFMPSGIAAEDSFQDFLKSGPALSTLTDTIAYALNLPLAVKQQLLAENNVDIRYRILMRCLEQQLSLIEDSDSVGEDFPPRFSDN